MDLYDCADRWKPILQIETANEVRKNAATVASFRNEMVRMNRSGPPVERLMSGESALAEDALFALAVKKLS